MELEKSLGVIREKISAALKKSGRGNTAPAVDTPDARGICVIGVTKTHNYEAIKDSIKCRLFDIGESYVQEAIKKIEDARANILAEDIKKITWHFIGGLQTNKIKYLKDNFSFIHSIDNERQIDELNKRITTPLKLFFEINTGNEESKSGGTYESTIKLVEKLLSVNAARMAELKPELTPYGLMCIPPASNNPEDSRRHFEFLRRCLEKLNGTLGIKMTGLSMGMSSDFDIAVEEGATHVRIGTVLYGEREYL
ncbi:MAG: YggS family pyridoxal phosphate-dependent enzyme [Pseudomonadota bacterium]